MDALLQQFGAALLTYGPGGIIAFAFGVLWWFERRDRKEAQGQTIKALNDWKTDSDTRGDKAEALVEKVTAALTLASAR